MTKKSIIEEILNLLEVVLTWPKWSIKISATTKKGNDFEKEWQWPLKKRKRS